MKILMVNNIFPPNFLGGYELGMLDVATQLTGRRHTVRVLTSDYFTDEKREITHIEVTRNLECVSISRRRVPPAVVHGRGPFVIGRNIRSMHAVMQEFAPDAVMLCNLNGLGALGLVQFVVSAGYRPVLYLMDDVFNNDHDGHRRWDRYTSLCGCSEYLEHVRPIAMSETLREEVQSTLGRDLPATAIIPGWYGTISQRSEVSVNIRRDDVCRFVFASQLAEHKGIAILLRAVALAKERGAKNFVVDLYGGGDSASVARQATALGISDIVRYRGTVGKAEMSKSFAEYDAFLMPTWEREPFGFVIPEAAVNGCVPIMTAQIGAAEWFLDGVDCLKLRRDPLSFAGGILKFLSLSAEGRARIRARARRTALTYLGLDRWIGVIERVLEAAAAAGGRWDADRARRSRAAMLFLDDLWGETIDATP
jgi:glycosyltransferase involved in cell wall biosynthesis